MKQQLAGKISWSSGLSLQQNLLNLANFIEEYKKLKKLWSEWPLHLDLYVLDILQDTTGFKASKKYTYKGTACMQIQDHSWYHR